MDVRYRPLYSCGGCQEDQSLGAEQLCVLPGGDLICADCFDSDPEAVAEWGDLPSFVPTPEAREAVGLPPISAPTGGAEAMREAVIATIHESARFAGVLPLGEVTAKRHLVELIRDLPLPACDGPEKKPTIYADGLHHGKDRLAAYPAVCPITGAPFFMVIEHDNLGPVPTYGGPYDSFTIPTREDRSVSFIFERYDHDAGRWFESACLSTWTIDEEDICALDEGLVDDATPEQRAAARLTLEALES